MSIKIFGKQSTCTLLLHPYSSKLPRFFLKSQRSSSRVQLSQLLRLPRNFKWYSCMSYTRSGYGVVTIFTQNNHRESFICVVPSPILGLAHNVTSSTYDSFLHPIETFTWTTTSVVSSLSSRLGYRVVTSTLTRFC